MKVDKDLSYFMNLKYYVILRYQNGLYYLFIPELSIIIEDENLGNAYDKLEEEKKQYFSKMINSNSTDAINEPNLTAIKNRFLSELPLFCAKVFVVILICISLFGAIVIGTLPVVGSIAYEMPTKVRKFTAAVVKKIIYTKISDKRKQEMRVQFRKILHELKPFVDDINTILLEKEVSNRSPVKKVDR